MTTYRTATGTIDVQVGDVLEYDDDGVTIQVEVTHADSTVRARWLRSVLPDGRVVAGDGREALRTMWLHDWRHVR